MQIEQKKKKMGTLFKSYCASSFTSPHVKMYGDWKKTNKECSFYIHSTYTVYFFVTPPRSHAAVCADMKNNILKKHPSNIFFSKWQGQPADLARLNSALMPEKQLREK